jgi:hypothetical protein
MGKDVNAGGLARRAAPPECGIVLLNYRSARAQYPGRRGAGRRTMRLSVCYAHQRPSGIVEEARRRGWRMPERHYRILVDGLTTALRSMTPRQLLARAD